MRVDILVGKRYAKSSPAAEPFLFFGALPTHFGWVSAATPGQGTDLPFPIKLLTLPRWTSELSRPRHGREGTFVLYANTMEPEGCGHLRCHARRKFTNGILYVVEVGVAGPPAKLFNNVMIISVQF